MDQEDEPMTQEQVLSIIKAIIRKKAKLHLSRRQIFLTKHVQFPGGVDRIFFGLTIEKHANAMFATNMAMEWAGSVAMGLMPTPTGVLSPAIVATSSAGGMGGATSSAVNARFDGAWNAGLKSLTPAAERTPHHYAINGSYLILQKAAGNVGGYGLIDIDAASVKWRSTDDFRQYALWKDELSDRPDLMNTLTNDVFPLGKVAGSPALSIKGEWVKL
jgi:hypothetical protein